MRRMARARAMIVRPTFRVVGLQDCMGVGLQGLLSDGKTLFLRNVNFHNSGSYSCEVVADSTFLTLIKSAHMQVVGKSPDPPL